MSDTHLRFDRFELQLEERRVLISGRELSLRGRAFDVLAVLARRPGGLVSKDELLQQVWPGLVVEEGNVAVQIAAVRRALYPEVIATVPGYGYRLTALPAKADADRTRTTAGTTLAPPSSASDAARRLIGREGDLARLRAALQAPGCVTLTGAGGVGKTALARWLCATWDLGAATWVDLSAWPGGEDLRPALYASLGAHPDGDVGDVGLATVLGGNGHLLVLDNAEHVLEFLAALLPRWLAALPSLRLLITSQAPLRVAGEHVERLDPLTLPPNQADDDEAARSGAVALFTERLRAAGSRQLLDGRALSQVRQLCARLDGLPLALEMAAARVPLLGLQGVLDAMDQRFALLRHGRRDSPPRQHSLLAAMDWSYGLLVAEDRQLFSALGVFAGSFTLDQVVAVAGQPTEPRWEVIDRLAVLVERSLVSVSLEDPPRYRLLESLRDYALQRLQAEGRTAELRGRHARAMLDAVRAADLAPAGAQRDALTERVLQDMAQVCDAFRWSVLHDHPTALALSAHAAGLVEFSAWRSEVFGWLCQCEPWVGKGADRALRARWWRQYARHLCFLHDPRATEAAAEATRLARDGADALALFWALAASVRAAATDAAATRATNRAQTAAWLDEMTQLLQGHPAWPPDAEVFVLGARAVLCSSIGDMEGALGHRRAEQALAHRSGLTIRAAIAELNVGWTLNRLGRHADALAVFRAFIDAASAQDFNTAYAQVHAVRSLILLDRLDEALAAAPAALAASRRVNWLEITGVAALLAARRGQLHTAALLLGHARQAHVARGLPAPDAPYFDYCQAAQRLQAQIDPGVLARLMARGATLDTDAADRLLLAPHDATP